MVHVGFMMGIGMLQVGLIVRTAGPTALHRATYAHRPYTEHHTPMGPTPSKIRPPVLHRTPYTQQPYTAHSMPTGTLLTFFGASYA